MFQFVRVEQEELDKLASPHRIIGGTNVHLRSGSACVNESGLRICLLDAAGHR